MLAPESTIHSVDLTVLSCTSMYVDFDSVIVAKVAAVISPIPPVPCDPFLTEQTNEGVGEPLGFIWRRESAWSTEGEDETGVPSISSMKARTGVVVNTLMCSSSRSWVEASRS